LGNIIFGNGFINRLTWMRRPQRHHPRPVSSLYLEKAQKINNILKMIKLFVFSECSCEKINPQPVKGDLYRRYRQNIRRGARCLQRQPERRSTRCR
jgi:hypothetical protein